MLSNSFGKMDLDSLSLVLQNTPADSASFQEYLSFFSRKGNDQKESKVLVANWLISASVSVGSLEVTAKSYHFLGHLATTEQRYDEAMTYFNKALEIAEYDNNYDVMARVYNSCGMMYYEYDQLDKAIENYKKAVTFALKTEKRKGLSAYYFNLAGMYFEMAQDNSDTVKMAINIANTAQNLDWQNKDTFGVITTQNGIAMMYLRIDLPDSSLKLLEENEVLIELTGLEDKYAPHYLRLGEVYVHLAEYELALEYLDLGMHYVRKYNDTRWEISYYKMYSKAFEGLSNYKEALRYNHKYLAIHDSLITQKNYASANEIRTRFETEKKEKEILRLNNENEIKKLKLEQDSKTNLILKVIVFSALTILITLGTLTFFLVRVNQERKQANIELERKNIEIQNQGMVLTEQSKVIARYQSQMNPHFVFNALNSIQGMVVNDEKESTIKQLQLLSRLMRDTINNSEKNLISLSEELNYLQRYVEFEQAKFINKIQFDFILPADQSDILIPPMMIQPFLENSMKHAKLHEVQNPLITLKIEMKDNLLQVNIHDNGCGFDASDTRVLKNSHAVSMIRSRLEMVWQVEGNEYPSPLFSIKSVSDGIQGTQIEFYLPLKYKY